MSLGIRGFPFRDRRSVGPVLDTRKTPWLCVPYDFDEGVEGVGPHLVLDQPRGVGDLVRRPGEADLDAPRITPVRVGARVGILIAL